MLRYHESIGPVPKAGRTAAGYQIYRRREVGTLRFNCRVRFFGIPIDRKKVLVGLWQDETRPSREVKRIALQQLAELDAKITGVRDALASLASPYRGESRPGCPILRDVEGLAPNLSHSVAPPRSLVATGHFGC